MATQPVTMTAADQAILSNPAADAPLEMRTSSEAPATGASPAAFPGSASEAQTPPAAEKKDDDDDSAKKDREEKPKSLAAVKVTGVGREPRAPASEMGLMGVFVYRS